MRQTSPSDDQTHYKEYIFDMLFLKRMSDSFDQERELPVKHHKSRGGCRKSRSQLSSEEIEVRSIAAP
ncbi:type I restriction-modification system subunit M N-terminal domain-containing protein [Nitrospira sp. BLG_2]|uniref:type I restriction-modification system subunit M N-terminal domain-containing protein n=1 Tax=Nitrospira sp. BLG_2 TaxID=3397507 RepID=UPI003B9B5CBB